MVGSVHVRALQTRLKQALNESGVDPNRANVDSKIGNGKFHMTMGYGRDVDDEKVCVAFKKTLERCLDWRIVHVTSDRELNNVRWGKSFKFHNQVAQEVGNVLTGDT